MAFRVSLAAFRIVADAMSPLLGQPVVIDNKAGGGGMVGTASGAKAKPDGYTLAMLCRFDSVRLLNIDGSAAFRCSSAGLRLVLRGGDEWYYGSGRSRLPGAAASCG